MTPSDSPSDSPRAEPPLTPAQRRALLAIVRCRTPALGGHVYRCTNCDETDYAYHSCHHRSCPRCGGARALPDGVMSRRAGRGHVANRECVIAQLNFG